MKLTLCPHRANKKDSANSGLHTNDQMTDPLGIVPVLSGEKASRFKIFDCHTQSVPHERSQQIKFAHPAEGDFFSGMLFAIPFLLMMAISAIPTKVFGQKVATKMVRAYMDNDFFAYQKEDGAYSNGLRFDYFYNKVSHPSARPLTLSAGDGSQTVVDVGVMQIMITPNDIRDKKPNRDDYPYSGSMFVNYSENSINNKKRTSVKTDYIVGIIGPKSFAGETQSFVHKVLSFAQPVGWNTQYHTTIFANVNLSTEKMIYSAAQGLELIAGAELDMGTLQNSAEIHSIIRIGKMAPYFSGYINQYTSAKGVLAYVFIKPQAQFVNHNTLLEGSALNYQVNVEKTPEIESILHKPVPQINHQLFFTNIGLVLAYRKFGFSATYTEGSAYLQHQPAKAFGNVSLYVGL